MVWSAAADVHKILRHMKEPAGQPILVKGHTMTLSPIDVKLTLKGALQHFFSMVRKRCQSVVEAPENTRAKYYSDAHGLEFTINSQSQLKIAHSSLDK